MSIKNNVIIITENIINEINNNLIENENISFDAKEVT